MQYPRCCTATLLIFIACWLGWASPAVRASATTQDSRKAAIVGWMNRVRNVEVSFSSETTFTPDPELLATLMRESAVVLHPYEGTFQRDEHFCFLKGRAMWDRKLTDKTKKFEAAHGFLEPWRHVIIISTERTETLYLHPNAKHPVGGIMNDPQFPALCPIDVALGLRMVGSGKWLIPGELIKYGWRLDSTGRVLISYIDIHHERHRWTFDPSVGYALVSYDLTNGYGEVYVRVSNGNFRMTDGVMLPYEVREQDNCMRGKKLGPVTQQVILRVHKYRLDDAKNVPGKYSLTWPDHTPILDERTDEHLAVEGSKAIDDAAIHNALTRAQRRIDQVFSGAAPTTQAATRP